MIGIYKWTSPSGKYYIGQAVDLSRRKKEFTTNPFKYIYILQMIVQQIEQEESIMISVNGNMKYQLSVLLMNQINLKLNLSRSLILQIARQDIIALKEVMVLKA